MQSDVFMDRAVTISEGGLSPTIKWKTLAAENFMVPPPEQQRELVELMQGFERAIEAGEESLTSGEQLRLRLMVKHFVDDANTSDWEPTPLEPMCTKITSGGTPSRSRAEFFQGEIPWVKTGELKDDYIFETEEYISSEAVENSSAKVFPEETVLVAMYGATIGQTAILGRPMATNQACCAFIANEEKLNFKYLHYLLLFNKEKLISLGIGAGQPNISQKVIKSLEFRIPPLSHQKNLVKLLSSTDALIDQQRRNLQYQRQLRFSILNSALSPSAQAEAAAEVPA